MSQPAIRVQNLSKRYRIGLKEETYDTFAGMLSDYARRPAHNLRRLRRLTRFDDPSSVEDDTIWALKDVSFDVLPGEVVGVIGRNGAGKSTLLKILSRITHPTSGRVELHGRVSSLLEVGTGFHPELTGRENIYLNGTILGMRKAEIDRKFDEIIEFSGVEKFIDTAVKRYSSGMRVRLAFAVAAHLEPEIMLVDEVLAVGDIEFQKKCLGKMGDLSDGGRTIIFVSHSLSAIENLCKRAILLNNGVTEYLGSVSKTIDAYLGGPNTPSASWVDLTGDITPRVGTQEIRVIRATVLDMSSEPTSIVPIGEGVGFRIAVLGNESVSDAEIAVGLFSIDGIRIAGFNSRDLSNWTVGVEAGEVVEVECKLPTINLAPGAYCVNLIVKNGFHQVSDYVERALTFEVAESDFFGNGRLPSARNLVFFRPVWSLK